MRLRIPGVEIQDVPAAVRFRFVGWRILLRERSEGADPAPLEMQPERVVQRVPRFMAQDAHALNVGAAFDFAHELALDFHQPRMRQIKRNRKARHAVGREPLRRQPHVRLEANAAIVQLAVQTFDVGFEKRSFDSDRQITDASVE